jgi:hypothetical protein
LQNQPLKSLKLPRKNLKQKQALKLLRKSLKLPRKNLKQKNTRKNPKKTHNEHI